MLPLFHNSLGADLSIGDAVAGRVVSTALSECRQGSRHRCDRYVGAPDGQQPSCSGSRPGRAPSKIADVAIVLLGEALAPAR